ncbi:hypothetical protein HX096_06075 [Empedobacter falsenii]|uniref:hypothetical protein n=1 Tax=Empedobacter falsenii TaxID=343874 RepID=UPI002574D78B|nr:hypothetical protein [Empedobacter falsenii]MDM1547427.1 hypothetical protein [Empedobacter falsenii]
MKKKLFASAFALFGSFVMANDKLETKEEIKIETLVDGSVLVITRVYGCNGEYLGSTSETVPCPSCEGANIKVTSTTVCFNPYEESFLSPEK